MATQKGPKSIVSTPSAHEVSIAPERSTFSTLILGNPNYFGTFPKLGGKVILKKAFDTAFEEVTCLGLQPNQARLEAVVNIKQTTGYGTDPCGDGSVEYVRFFVQDTMGWHDLGLQSFHVYNIAAGAHPLSYCASVDFTEGRKFCFTENIVNVRAILSWNLAPTAGDPNFMPPWGNVLDARVQVAPEFLIPITLETLVAEKLVLVNPQALQVVDTAQKLPPKEQKPLEFAELKTLYAKTDVPSHRFGFKQAQKILASPIASNLPVVTEAFKTAPVVSATLTAGDELGAILGGIVKSSGDTTFEQLMCAGFNPETRELEAVVQIKKNAGYSGGLCSAGSTEYVSFFGFIGGAWQSLGTGTVNVHDLAAVTPGNPLMYAVYRVSNLTEAACAAVAGVPLRAILSWEQQPTGPDFVPVWGNIVNTQVQPIIGETLPGEHIRLMRLGSVSVNGISDVNGLANPTGIAGDCVGNNSPFGGEIIVEGDFTPKIDVFNHTTGVVLPGAKPIIYQVWVTRTDVVSAPVQLTNPFGIGLFPPDALFPPLPFTQSVQPAPGTVIGGIPGTQYYQYMESDLQAVNPRTLAAFEAGGLAEGDYFVEVRGWSFNGLDYVPMMTQGQLIHVYNGFPHTELVPTVGGLVAVTMYRPQVAITLISIVDCGNAKVGDTLIGSYSVSDNFFGAVSIALVPITVGGVPQPENTVVLSNANSGPNQVVYDGTNTDEAAAIAHQAPVRRGAPTQTRHYLG